MEKRKKNDCILISCSHSVKWKFSREIISFHSVSCYDMYLSSIFISQSESSIVFRTNLINCSFYRDVYIASILWTESPTQPNTIKILVIKQKRDMKNEQWTFALLVFVVIAAAAHCSYKFRPSCNLCGLCTKASCITWFYCRMLWYEKKSWSWENFSCFGPVFHIQFSLLFTLLAHSRQSLQQQQIVS